MRRVLREPLLHFLALGAVLFGLYGWVNRGGFDAPDEIVVSRGQVQSLATQFQRVWQRSPTRVELQSLIDEWVREEIYYREALAMGLDRDDPVVRRRMSQKVQFIVDSAVPTAPTTAELQQWLDEHAADYGVEPRYDFRQVYFDPAKHGARIDDVVATSLRQLTNGKASVGDPTMLPPTLHADASEVARTFGRDFEVALRDGPVDTWYGPVRSGFGLHLVRVTTLEAARKPPLEEVREAVERDLLHARSQAAKDAYYDRLRGGYSVTVAELAQPQDRP